MRLHAFFSLYWLFGSCLTEIWAWSSLLCRARVGPRLRRAALFQSVIGADVKPLTVSSAGNDNNAGSTASDIPLQPPTRGKVNEIDFCIAPADVSLSRAYGIVNGFPATGTDGPIMSLTRALNNASNRAVRRILLARSWPSAEALNLSLRQVAAAEKERAVQLQQASLAKCPVPRPILNVLTRRKKAKPEDSAPKPRSRTDEEYVADQIKNFRERYGSLPGYALAEDYLQAILNLATSGVEAETATAVLKGGVYDEAYKRVLSVLSTAGIIFEQDAETGRGRIASKLSDRDICLSMIDKLKMRGENAAPSEVKTTPAVATPEAGAITNEDLGGVLLSAKEPSMTRQLNSLANIVERALLFGSDQELLVLAETLDADRAAFVDRWYPGTGGPTEVLEQETRPGLQFLNCLVKLLRDCYDDGVVTNLNPPLPLLPSYANAYERLVASAVELGSGYLKPFPNDILALPPPRTATEELGRFATWESTFRQNSERNVLNHYPEDLVGTWEVRDEIGGEVIGMTTIEFAKDGDVVVKKPLDGLRWRLDAGPTHLDTCTFQVLSNDGTILQYRGFIDRGARLEARFSKRPIKIRGSVMFQMRDGSVDYYKDILPINYRTGATKFVMTKLDDGSLQ